MIENAKHSPLNVTNLADSASSLPSAQQLLFSRHTPAGSWLESERFGNITHHTLYVTGDPLTDKGQPVVWEDVSLSSRYPAIPFIVAPPCALTFESWLENTLERRFLSKTGIFNGGVDPSMIVRSLYPSGARVDWQGVSFEVEGGEGIGCDLPVSAPLAVIECHSLSCGIAPQRRLLDRPIVVTHTASLLSWSERRPEITGSHVEVNVSIKPALRDSEQLFVEDVQWALPVRIDGEPSPNGRQKYFRYEELLSKEQGEVLVKKKLSELFRTGRDSLTITKRED